MILTKNSFPAHKLRHGAANMMVHQKRDQMAASFTGASIINILMGIGTDYTSSTARRIVRKLAIKMAELHLVVLPGHP